MQTCDNRMMVVGLGSGGLGSATDHSEWGLQEGQTLLNKSLTGAAEAQSSGHPTPPMPWYPDLLKDPKNRIPP